jgi:hypothetical protein
MHHTATAKDGSHVPVITKVANCELAGKPVLVGVSQDMTDQRQQEKEVTLLSRALEMTADAVTITDIDGTNEPGSTGHNGDCSLARRRLSSTKRLNYALMTAA